MWMAHLKFESCPEITFIIYYTIKKKFVVWNQAKINYAINILTEVVFLLKISLNVANSLSNFTQPENRVVIC